MSFGAGFTTLDSRGFGAGLPTRGAGFGAGYEASVAAPSLTYVSPQSWTYGVAITPVSPTVTGSPTYADVGGSLAAIGLAVHATTGVISGTISDFIESGTVTVRATNAAGTADAVISYTMVFDSLLTLVADWDPSDIATLWQNTGKSVAVSADGDPVRVVADKSGNGNDLVFPSDAARATYKANIYGGKPVLRFNGSSHYAVAAVTAITGTKLGLFAFYIRRGSTTNTALVGLSSSTGSGVSYDSAATGIPIIDLGGKPEVYRNAGEKALGPYPYVIGDPIASAVIFDGTYSRIWHNRDRWFNVADSGSFNFDRIIVGSYYAGANDPAGHFGQNDMGRILVFTASAFGGAVEAKGSKFIAGKYSVPFLKGCTCDGDSLTSGFGVAAADAYPAQLQASLGATWAVRNMGVSGQSVVNMETDAATEIDVCYASDRSKNILVAWGGTNDMASFGSSAAQAYADFVTYCTNRRAAGWKVVAMTMIPREADATLETKRLTFNTSIRNNWATFADALVDLGLDANIGLPGSQNNATYFQADTIHLKAAGMAIVSAAAATAVGSL